MIPTTKISQTILEYGKAVILKLPDDHTKEEFEMALRIIIVAWNAVVIDSWNNENKCEAELLKTLDNAPHEMVIMVKQLLKRKKNKFATDPRSIGNHWVRKESGEFIFGCEARLNVENIPVTGGVH